MSRRLPPKNSNGIFNVNDFKWSNEDVIISVNELNVKYEQQMEELKKQVDKLTCLIYDMQKTNARVDDKTSEITNSIQQMMENNNTK